MTSKSVNPHGQLSAHALAGVLASAIAVVVIVLNLAGSDEASIRLEQFERLVDEDLVEGITVSGEVLHVRLRRAIRLAELQSGSATNRVGVRLSSAPGASRFDAWRQRGIEVGQSEATAGEPQRQIVFAAVVGILLAAGTWYLVARARADRHNGPRQRLQDAEAEFRAGRLSSEEYRERVDAISLEL